MLSSSSVDTTSINDTSIHVQLHVDGQILIICLVISVRTRLGTTSETLMLLLTRHLFALEFNFLGDQGPMLAQDSCLITRLVF